MKTNLFKSLRLQYLLTLFAPTDAAFRRGSCDLGLNITQCLLADGNRLLRKKFLNHHIFCGAEYSKSLIQRGQVTSVDCFTSCYNQEHMSIAKGHKGASKIKRRYCYKKCNKIPITVGDDAIGVGTTGAVIKQRDIPARNGVVHLISLPLVHPWLNLTIYCAGFTADNCDTIN